MAFSLSPSVDVKEIDYTFNIPATSVSAGGFAGTFQWGPVEEFRFTTSPQSLAATFFHPNDATAISYFTAENFLQYSANLAVIRVVGELAKNATSVGSAGQLIKNLDDYTQNFSTNISTYGNFAAKFPGALGNGIKVSICDNTNYTRTASGTVTTLLSSNEVVGVGTSFDVQMTAGSYLRDITGALIGQVDSVTSATSLTLKTNASVAVTTALVTSEWEFKSQFSGAPLTSVYAASKGGSKDEIHVIIVDTLGNFSSAPNTVLKAYPYLSVALDGQNQDGTSAYYKTVINRDNQHVWHMSHPVSGTNWGTLAANTTFASLANNLVSSQTVTLANGVSDDTMIDSMALRGFMMFSNPDTIDVGLIPVGGVSMSIANSIISNIAEVRKDCVVFVSPTLANVYQNLGKEATDIITSRNALPSSSYAVMDSGWKYQYDQYNDVYRWLPLNGDTAGLCARTDATNDVWWSPAGYNRGQIKNVVKLAYNPSKTDRDLLFPLGINPVVSQKGQGTFLFGDKTLLSRPSAFDAINVRRLFILLEKAIGTAAKYKLFEFNDATTRNSFLSAVNPYLRTVKGGRGIVDFRVVCDSTNNTTEVINGKRFVASLFIQPNLAIRNIELNFVAVPSGFSFTEITNV